MAGDLGGLRPAHADAGVTYTLAFTAEIMSNVEGGLEQDAAADLLMDWVIDADLSKAFGWTGGAARINPMWLAGTAISDDVGDLTRVSNITGREGVRVFEAWLQQTLFNGALSLRAGILAADQEFAFTAAGALYFNSAFGASVFTSANLSVPIYPVGAPGARARIDFTKTAYFQAAVYDGDPGTESFNRSGLRVRMTDEEGLFSIAESGITLGETVLKAGGFLHTARAVDSLAGGYAVVEQKLSRELGIDVFLRLGYAQEDRSVVSHGLDCGINFTGVIPRRPADVLGIGFIYARIGRDFAQAQPNRRFWGYESVIEVTYKIAFSPWLSVQPDIQVVVHPGGSTELADAVVLGLRLDVLF